MSNLSDFINTGIGGGGINEIEIKTSEMIMDLTDTGVDSGTVFDIYDSYDFPPAGPGAVWFNFLFPDGFDYTKRVVFDISYNCNGNDPGKKIVLTTSLWVNVAGDIPTEASPTLVYNDEVDTAGPGPGHNIGVISYMMLPNAKIGDEHLSSATNKIGIRVKRDTDHANDNYTGTFQLMSIKIRQIEVV